MQVVHSVCVCMCVCTRERSEQQRDPNRWGPRGGEGRVGWGPRVANLGGRRDGTQCDLSPAICSSINHGRIYTHTATHTVLHVGTRTWLFQSVRKGRGRTAAGWGGPLPETRVGLKHALWAATYHCTAGGV